MNIHTTTLPAHFHDSLDSPIVAKNRKAHRVVFTKDGLSGPGVYAELPAPNEGRITSLGVKLNGMAASGTLCVSTINPKENYDAFFLYAILDNVPLTTKGPVMWRRTEILGVSYSTIQANQGHLYLLILDGPSADVLADCALTVETD